MHRAGSKLARAPFALEHLYLCLLEAAEPPQRPPERPMTECIEYGRACLIAGRSHSTCLLPFAAAAAVHDGFLLSKTMAKSPIGGHLLNTVMQKVSRL